VNRVKTFRFEFTVSNEFLTTSPVAPQFIAARQASVAKLSSAVGPRGGLYRLDPDEPLVWESARDGYYDFLRNETRYRTRRTGRYVRPDRVTPELRLGPEFTYETFTLPVVEGIATLPDGRKVETDSQFVDVPVPTA
jgi:hypothetical protein